MDPTDPLSGMEEPEGAFPPQAVVAGRYRILRFLARGGAGEVYEALDLQLDLRIALKTVRRETATDRKTLERFKREIQLARQVTHPNVCRIFDLGREPGGPLFLTMELLEGESLYDRIRRRGPLSTEEALPIARQIASGLDAACEAGVIHRDLKSGNVMLVARPDGGERAVITDFGLARSLVEDSGLTATAETLIVGTPAYMAPEQVESGEITPATDLYAVGVVLFEMLTGRYPFDARTPLALAMKRLTDPPSSPRLYVPDLDPRWEAAILRCLERDPESRFRSGRELIAALEGAPAAAGAPRRVATVPAAVALGLAAVLAAVLVVRGPPSGETGQPTSPLPEGDVRSVAFVGLRNLSGDPAVDWMGPALVEMLGMEAVAGEDLRLVPAESVARAVGESADRTSGDLVDVAARLGGPYLVEGAYVAVGEPAEVRLDLRVHEPARAEVVARISERGPRDGLLGLVERTGTRLREALGGAPLSAEASAAIRSALPADRAVRSFSEGLEHLRRYEAREAITSLEEALQHDADNALIHSALSAAWSSLGYRDRGRSAARAALEASADLSRRDRLLIEARWHEAEGDDQKALEIHARLWDYFPDDVEIGLGTARALTAEGRNDEASRVLGRLRETASVAERPRIDLAAAEVARAVSDYAEQRRWALEAAAAARLLGARQLEARAREVEAGALRDLGATDEALEAYREAEAIYEESGDRGRSARVAIARAKVLRHRGRLDEAREAVESALEVAREIGDQGSVRHGLNTLAIIHRQQGDLHRALALHQLELEAERESGEARSLQVALTSIGVVERELGRFADAEARFVEALELGRQTGNLRSVEINLNLLGDVLLHRGEPDAAREKFQEALAVNRDTGSPRGRAYYLAALAGVDLVQDRLLDARELLLEARRIRVEIGEATNVAFTDLELARLELAAGRPDAALDRARTAGREFAREGKGDGEIWARALEMLATAGLGRSGEAARIAATIDLPAARIESPEIRWRIAMALAAVTGQLEPLEAAVREAGEQQDLLLELELRLVRGRLRSDGEELSAVRDRAAAVGYSRWRREAEEALSGAT